MLLELAVLRQHCILKCGHEPPQVRFRTNTCMYPPPPQPAGKLVNLMWVHVSYKGAS